MLHIERKEDCCGCNACGDICPKGAITFQTDEEGFWYPSIDEEKCVNCGLCEKVCPVIHAQELKHNDLEQSICFAAENKNMEVIFDSTSGGLFSALADYTYRQGGYVGGAVFNEDFSVSHFISKDKSDLPRLRSSKYLQSNASGIYRQIQELLSAGERVLVCGTPCQMAALRAYLGKDYPTLLIVDFVCLGINSPLVWRRYLDSFVERYGSPVVYCKAKSKEYGWRNLTQKVILADGRQIFEPKDVCMFTKGYIGTHLYCRPSCYACKFKGFPRMADITLADFWGIEKFSAKMEKNLGTSLVMLNSQKGADYFEAIKNRVNFIPTPFETILPGNPALTRPLISFNKDRAAFFRDVKNLPFGDVVEKYSAPQAGRASLKATVKKALKGLSKKFRLLKLIIKTTRLHPSAIFQTLRYSGLSNLWHGRGIIFSTYCTTNISRKAHIELKGLLIFGSKGLFPKSSLETRLSIAEGGKLSILGDVSLGYGSDIEVHEGGHLLFHGKKYVSSGSNIGLTIVCQDRIEIGADVQIGRNVLIRDNNGKHYLNRQGYKNSRPVIIGDKVWLCESCTIMPGIRIGEGAVIGAKSFVVTPVPAHTLVSGSPAKVIDRDIQWKY